MGTNETILRVVGHHAVVTDEGIEFCVLPTPGISEPAAVCVPATQRRKLFVHDRILFQASVAHHRHVACSDRRARRVGCGVSIVEVPPRKGVESDEHPRQREWASDWTADTFGGKAVDVEILQRNVRGCVGRDDAPIGKVAYRNACAAPRWI